MHPPRMHVIVLCLTAPVHAAAKHVALGASRPGTRVLAQACMHLPRSACHVC